MIAILTLRLHRAWLQWRVRWHEAELESIAAQRKNDEEAEEAIEIVVARDRRRIRAMIEQEQQAVRRELFRRLGS